MKPVNFKEANVVFAENQKEYLPLPTHKTEDGIVTSCWKFSFIEKLRVLFCGRIYLSTMTFNKPLQPQKLQLKLDVENIWIYMIT